MEGPPFGILRRNGSQHRFAFRQEAVDVAAWSLASDVLNPRRLV
jgi:hypothetical protein